MKNKYNQIETGGLSTEKILLRVCNLCSKNFSNCSLPVHHLDIGAGNGELIRLIGTSFSTQSSAVDYTDTLMTLPNQKVDVCDLNKQKLPYDDNTFDLVTFTEVIEHIENHRFTLSEIARVLKPGGFVILSTPNVLNLKSRIRFLFCGFWNLFGPLKVGDRKLESTGGHINPMHYFLMIHSLLESGFEIEDETCDKRQSSSLFLLILFFLPVKIFSFFHFLKEKKKYHSIDSRNEKFVKNMNSNLLLTARTIIVSARKI